MAFKNNFTLDEFQHRASASFATSERIISDVIFLIDLKILEGIDH